MRDHSDCKRGFYHVSKSIYADGKTWRNGEYDEITLGFYDPYGGTTGEFVIAWNQFGPQLRVFADAWAALLGFADLLKAFAEHDGEDLTPEAVITLLKELGVEDTTPYERT